MVYDNKIINKLTWKKKKLIYRILQTFGRPPPDNLYRQSGNAVAASRRGILTCWFNL